MPDRWIARRRIIIAGLFVAVAGCKATAGESCSVAEDCEAGLGCHEAICKPESEVARALEHKRLVEACSAKCSQDGRCGAADGACVARDDEDCLQSTLCKVRGTCSAAEGRCVAARDEDCRRSKICEEQDKCRADDGRCKLSLDACKKRDACEERGRCSVKDERCVAATDEDCEASRGCWLRAECSADAKKGACVIARDEDCERSLWCARFAYCEQANGGCARGDEPIRDSAACLIYGCCEEGPAERCRVVSEDDCANARLCEREGKCIAKERECVKSCAQTTACRRDGLCSDGPGTTCRADSDVDCSLAVACKMEGRCTAEQGRCIEPEDDSDDEDPKADFSPR